MSIKTERIIDALREADADDKTIEYMEEMYSEMEAILSDEEMMVLVNYYENPNFQKIWKVQRLASEKIVYRVMNDAMMDSVRTTPRDSIDTDLQKYMDILSGDDDYGDN